MELLMKKLHGALILAVVLALSLSMMPTVYSAEFSAPDEALVFLEDVIMLDLPKYNTKLVVDHVFYPSELGGLAQEIGKFSLEAEESKLNVLFKAVNKTLVACILDVLEGSPLYIQQPSSNQTYTGALDLEDMRNMLDIVDVTKNMETTVGNVKLEVSSEEDQVLFDWTYSFNGADYTGIYINFRDGSFESFRDDRSYYKIGSTDVNVSKEEAIDIALKRMETYSWKLGSGEEVSDFNIVEERIGAELLTRNREEPLIMYPYWLIQLPLDKVYPGMVTRIIVAIWAGTSEILYVKPLSYGGGPTPETLPTEPTPEENLTVTPTEPSQTPEPSSSPSTSPSPQQTTSPSIQQTDHTTPSIDPFLLAVAAATIIAIAIATIALKKKHK